MIIELVPEARARMVQRRRNSPCAHWFNVLDDVKDPEIPVLSIWELGVLQDVVDADGVITAVITPTYSGCPAMAMIEAEICTCLLDAGAAEARVETRLSPAWTTDWMDARARLALNEYGIAPPDSTACPQCGATDTEVISEFGSTACKALYRCRVCLEPFDHFKRI